MTPQERQEFNTLKQQVEDLKLARDVVFTESLRKRMLDDYIETGVATDASTSDINILVAAVPATVAKQFDDKVQVNIGGVNYYIGLYNV